MLKKEAFVYASQEIDRSITERLFADTVYNNSTGTLSIYRRVEPDGKLNKITAKIRLRF